MFTKQQIKRAPTHDWFIRSEGYLNLKCIVVQCCTNEWTLS